MLSSRSLTHRFCRMIPSIAPRYQSTKTNQSTLIIGAAGAVGKRLCAALAQSGHRVIATDRMEELPDSLKKIVDTTVGSIDVTDPGRLRRLFREHADENTTVWNLAAPLSVETAMDPGVAEAVTIGGMTNVIEAMSQVGARKICFTDSIGSFGAEAPRSGATARWLTENPTQDPGSDYGLQKRGCRELMAKFAKEQGGDPRFAVLPGVLHSEPIWGNGTTEYALDALLAAPHQATKHGLPTGDAFVCPVDPDVKMPMIFVDDLMRGLVALQEADEAGLNEPQNGYCIPGLSFTPNELFAEIRKHHPGFGFRVELDENMNKFANLWPDELSSKEAKLDLGYEPKVGLTDMVANVLFGHETRNELTAKAFKAMDIEQDGKLDRLEIEYYVKKYHLATGREDYSNGRVRADAVVDKLMKELDNDNDGIIDWFQFSEWNRNNSIEKIVKSSFNAPEYVAPVGEI